MGRFNKFNMANFAVSGRRTGLCFVLALLALALPLHAAPVRSDSTTTRLVLKDGSILVGTIVRQDSTSIVIRTKAGGVATVPRSAVVERVPLFDRRGCGFGRDDVRLFLMPTAKTLPRGCSYFGVYELLFPHVAAGIADWITLAGGMTMFPGAWIFVAAKVGLVRGDRFQVAAGGMVTILGRWLSTQALYGVATLDWNKSSFTLGILSLSVGDEKTPLLVFGGQTGSRRGATFVTENYLDLQRGKFWPGFGLRLAGRRVSADLAFQLYWGRSRSWALPWVAFTYEAK